VKKLFLVLGFAGFIGSALILAGTTGCGNNAPTSTGSNPTSTFTPQFSSTVTNTRTVTNTPTVTNTRTVSLTPTVTHTPTATRTPTLTKTPTDTRTPTATPTSTVTATPTVTPTCAASSGTYGQTGTNVSLNINNLIALCQITVVGRVQMTDIQAYICSSDGTTPENATAGIYSNVSGAPYTVAAGAPGTLLAPAVTMPVSTCGGAYTFSLASSIYLSAGNYWIAVGGTDGSDRGYQVQTGVAGYGLPGGTLPTTFPDPTTLGEESGSNGNNWTVMPQFWIDWTCP
jgi:hypothetical protein